MFEGIGILGAAGTGALIANRALPDEVPKDRWMKGAIAGAAFGFLANSILGGTATLAAAGFLLWRELRYGGDLSIQPGTQPNLQPAVQPDLLTQPYAMGMVVTPEQEQMQQQALRQEQTMPQQPMADVRDVLQAQQPMGIVSVHATDQDMLE